MSDRYAVAIKNIATLWDAPSETVMVDGDPRSAIGDEVLCGMGLAITGEPENGFLPVRTHYGYKGYIRPEDIREISLEDLKEWENSRLMVVNGICTDITSIPKVQGIRCCSLYRGALVKVLALDSAEQKGWAKVELPDGRIGFMRNQFLSEKKFSQSGLWQEELPQNYGSSETELRDAVVKTALSYLGVQYRWGGKSTAGIDCSGLTSISYMRNGILTYRDAKIVEGYPVHEIPKDQIKKGDLLYFPGHIAMYIGDDRYVHSTGKIGSGGVVINSLNPADEDYREDLVSSMYAAGSIF